MNPSLSALRNDVHKVEVFFCREGQNDSLPFVHSFPKNSCEVVSAFLAVAAASKYSGSIVVVARAYCRSKNEWHFWVEVGGFVVDVTAHQFTEYEHPLICAVPSPLEMRFPDVERLRPEVALDC